MNRIGLIMLIVIGIVGCKPQSNNFNKVSIENKDSIKNIVVEITHTDTLIFEVPSFISDSLILISVKASADSLRRDNLRRDSLHTINFRRITKIINGGYNGYTDREKIWIKAKQVLNEKEKSQ